MPIKEYKTFSDQYDYVLTFVGLFIPVPMSQAKYTPDFIIKDWGFGCTVGINKIPLGLIMIIIALIF